MPSLVGGFVGSDLLAVALATRIDRKPGVRLALDIGTNTELLLSVDGRLFSLFDRQRSGAGRRSAALRLGWRAAGVGGCASRLNPGDGSFLSAHPHHPRQAGNRDLRLGHRRGAGLHGAGRHLQRLSGRIQAGKPGVSEGFGWRPPFHAGARAHDRSRGRPDDLCSTMCPGNPARQRRRPRRRTTLLAEHGLTVDDLDELLVAGAFGNHIEVESAQRDRPLPRHPAGTHPPDQQHGRPARG